MEHPAISDNADRNNRADGKTRVLVVSQQSLLREGIERLLSGIADIEIWGVSNINETVLTMIENIPPDVAIVDIDAPTDNGLFLAGRLKQRSPSIGIIMLANNLDDSQVFQTLKFQASACLEKDVTADDLLVTVRRVASGEHPINDNLTDRPKVAEQVLQQFQKLSWQMEVEEFISPLTPRETEILDYIAKGYLNKQIALKLGISEQTIKNHVTSILRKLNANARTEAVVVAIRKGLISIA